MRPALIADEDVDAFVSLVHRREVDACWEWQGGCNGDGYGYFKRQRAHRIAYSLVNGVPSRLILHKCNNRLCCNPQYLYDGSHKQNMQDMTKAGTHDGRNRRGEKHPYTTLTRDDVSFIRRSTLSGVALAERFGVSPATISMIRHNKRWVYE